MTKPFANGTLNPANYVYEASTVSPNGETRPLFAFRVSLFARGQLQLLISG
jgi:hypothetical protein